MKTIVHSLGIQSIACKSRISSYISIFFAILIPSAFAGVPPPLISNGGFENGFDGWQKGGNVVVKSTSPYVPAAGAKLAVFNSVNTSPGGFVARTVPTAAGATYRLHFAAGTLSYLSAAQRIGVTVSGEASLLSQTLTIRGAVGGKSAWTDFSFPFVADSPTVTLRFRDLSQVSNGIDLLLDKVVLEKVNFQELRVDTNIPYPVEVVASPADWNGMGGGATPFVRRYEIGSMVKLNAPASLVGVGPYRGILPRRTYRFQHWLVRDEVYETSNETIAQVYVDQTFTAVYEPGPPIITEQPQNLSVPLGSSATFRVAVDAPGTFYRWWFNGQPLDNTNSETFTIPSVSAADAGSYQVVCGDLGGAVTSEYAILHVIAPPFGNGGFENGSDGWSATGNVRFISSPLYPPVEGKALANFNAGDSEPNGLLSQTFATIPGNSYVLRFDVGILSNVNLKQKLEIEISSAGAGPWLFSEQAKGSGAVQWFEMMIPFTAIGDPTVVTFRDTSDATRSIDMLLDDVSLTEVPMGFALVFPERFEMGGRDGEIGHGYGEDLHEVSFTRHLLVRKTELTWQEWSAVRALASSRGYHDMPAGRNGYIGGSESGHPVTEVNWWDAVKWCNLKSEMEGLTPVYYTASALEPANILRNGMPLTYVNWNADGYRLPTESEWEYFCRAGSTAGFFTGPMLYLHGEPEPYLDMAGWYSGNSGNTHPVGLKQANAWGIYDTHGNVWEWCSDWFEEIYPAGPVIDPIGPSKGADRMIRGGSFHMSAYWCRSAQRGWHLPEARYWYLGFRPVRTLIR